MAKRLGGNLRMTDGPLGGFGGSEFGNHEDGVRRSILHDHEVDFAIGINRLLISPKKKQGAWN